MPKSVNSAFRIHRILEIASRVSDKPTYDAWVEILGLPCQTDQQMNQEKAWSERRVSAKVFQVTEKLILLGQELDKAFKKTVENVKLSSELYEEAFSAVEKMINPKNLYLSWAQTTKQLLTKETMSRLQICYELLPNEEELISGEDSESLLKEIEDFETSIRESKYPDELKLFVEQQLRDLKDAIRDYFIVGIQAFRDAFWEAHTIILKNQEPLRDVPTKDTKSTLTKIGAFWDRVSTLVGKASTTADKASKLLVSGNKIIEHGSKLLDNITN